MVRRLIVASSLALSFSVNARAEYRAYELAVVHEGTGNARTVVSTLDDLQYPSYHPLNPGERVVIRATWMCWARSDHFKAICPDPKAGAGPTANSTPAAPAAP